MPRLGDVDEASLLEDTWERAREVLARRLGAVSEVNLQREDTHQRVRRPSPVGHMEFGARFEHAGDLRDRSPLLIEARWWKNSVERTRSNEANRLLVDLNQAAGFGGLSQLTAGGFSVELVGDLRRALGGDLGRRHRQGGDGLLPEGVPVRG